LFNYYNTPDQAAAAEEVSYADTKGSRIYTREKVPQDRHGNGMNSRIAAPLGQDAERR
jgi:hypothetical protein